ncbi:MAG: Na-translocating system protein MpsC family protein [Anaerotignum sp.]|nr:Na-translocating system protein MpsC family protein [Anaerotignum sp.]
MMQDCSKRNLDQMLSSYIGKLYKEIAGKGPENVYVAFGDACYIVYIKNYFMPYEKIIQQDGDKDLLDKVMHVATKNLNAQIVQYTEIITGVSTEETYYDWNTENGSRVLVGMSKRQFQVSSSVKSDYYGEQLLHKELIRLGHFADSIPETINSFCLSSKFFIFERGGGTTRLEREMELMGYGEVIKKTKRQIEKQYLNNNLCIKNVLDMEIIDTFIDWNFNKNKSIVVLVKSTSEVKMMRCLK